MKEIIKTIFKCLFFGFIWSIIICAISYLVPRSSKFEYADILFVISLLTIILSFLMTKGGNLTGVGSINPSNAVLLANEASKKDSDRYKDYTKNIFALSFSALSLLFGGVISVIISFII